ncbi:MAG: Gfo/Idh/MocA family oxidoreductase [Gemmataceae bacterium]|nr:Gfo/Idh/MocA family oxidoreductase [Gemmataceae bacterium]
MSDSPGISRRRFLVQGSALAAGLAVAPAIAANTDKKLVIGVMGLGRGLDHVKACVGLPDVEIAYVCDVDDKRVQRALNVIKEAQPKQAKPTEGIKDFRKVLDDKNVDALTIAAPNHWHTPAAILACQAGKHVYVEKPGSHNAREGELIVAAARKHNRVVQMGNQRRSWPAVIEAIEKLRGGAIGTVRSARTWYNNKRGTIGKGKPAAVPAELDYALWQGPAPKQEYKDNVVHYHWHWRWHWGGGELANNGIHALDLARWGLGVDCPSRVVCGGGRYHFQDDQETPDTTLATFDFGDKFAIWDGSSCHARSGENLNFVVFYGDNGSLALGGGGSYKILDPKGKEIGTGKSDAGDRSHFVNFFDCIRNSKRPNSDIEEGQKSTLLCHLGNIAFRTGRTINVDPKTRTIVNDKDAIALWGREYQKEWEPKV